MSSSGLIYAVIVGAWAAYLVPMWLRRQDELNEARPTERFSTAIRLLSGRAGMERRYAKDLARSADEAEPGPDVVDPDAVTDSVDVRAFAVPPDDPGPGGPERRRGEPSASRRRPGPADPPAGADAGRPGHPERVDRGERADRADRADRAGRVAAERDAEVVRARVARTRVLARRRRTITLLFLAFTVGAVAAAVGGVAFLWAPAAPAVLLSVYIAYLRTQERRRFAYRMDRGQAEEAARRVRERGRERDRERGGRRRPRPSAEPATDGRTERIGRGPRTGAERAVVRPGEAPRAPREQREPREPEGHDPGPATLSSLAADRLALIEQTDHAEWVDQQREPEREEGPADGWEPVPVPLPTYVTAPVAPRATSDLDLTDDAWSSARAALDPDRHERPAAPEESAAPAEAAGPPPAQPEPRGRSGARRGRGRGRTPLFDQYAESDRDRPRAANE
ncbi:hypothetical protein [Streptomyces sp. NPDC047130]|uniref:hypothetical protein n=1 Tax=Streptomyces sp. NPDC047130 TaxID=3155261 RepID=UPI0033D895F8